jgi:NAD+ diphosphatase
MQNLYPFFSQNPLDRLDLVRRDKKLFADLLNSEDAQFLLLDESNIIFDETKRQCFFSKDILNQFDIDEKNIVLLGRENSVDYFAISIKEELSKKFTKVSIRDFVNLDFLEEERFGILAQAACVLNWHDTHQHCNICGGETSITHAGWRRDCLTCKKQHFPKVEPVVIMLVTHGDFCLLGNGVRFKENRYSCLAGFVESGESIEDAARRELYEEAGVIGLEVSYISSQPWPFPSTLMIGTHVRAESMELNIDYHELNDAKWFHKDDLKALLNGDESLGFELPQKIASARNLLEVWVKE